MALIKCPECGREISDRALSCPGCGIAKDDIQKMFVEQNANDAKLHIDYDKLKKKEFNFREISDYPTISIVPTSDKILYAKNQWVNGESACGMKYGKFKYAACEEGDIIRFGNYANKPIEWIVLKIINNKALIISRNIIDLLPYNEKREDAIWKECSLRRYLNNEFVEKSFSKEEKLLIEQVCVKDTSNRSGEMSRKKETVDMVFCLSLSEVFKYFEFYKDRVAIPTEYVKRKASEYNIRYLLDEKRGGGDWWLRSMGIDGFLAPAVGGNGFIMEPGNLVNSISCGVRPALWICIK